MEEEDISTRIIPNRNERTSFSVRRYGGKGTVSTSLQQEGAGFRLIKGKGHQMPLGLPGPDLMEIECLAVGREAWSTVFCVSACEPFWLGITAVHLHQIDVPFDVVICPHKCDPMLVRGEGRG
jgi:hypothetical protein